MLKQLPEIAPQLGRLGSVCGYFGWIGGIERPRRRENTNLSLPSLSHRKLLCTTRWRLNEAIPKCTLAPYIQRASCQTVSIKTPNRDFKLGLGNIYGVFRRPAGNSRWESMGGVRGQRAEMAKRGRRLSCAGSMKNARHKGTLVREGLWRALGIAGSRCTSRAAISRHFPCRHRSVGMDQKGVEGRQRFLNRATERYINLLTGPDHLFSTGSYTMASGLTPREKEIVRLASLGRHPRHHGNPKRKRGC